MKLNQHWRMNVGFYNFESLSVVMFTVQLAAKLRIMGSISIVTDVKVTM